MPNTNAINRLGESVSISGDGNTIAAGTPATNSYEGAIRIFEKTSSGWNYIGYPLVGTGTVNQPYGSRQGMNVDLNYTGDMAVTGGRDNNTLEGGMWVFVRKGGSWNQLGNKLLGNGATESNAKQGHGIGISADGSVMAEGSRFDDDEVGSLWIFKNDRYLGVTNPEVTDLEIVPNPGSGQFQIRASTTGGAVQGVSIMNAAGQQAREVEFSSLDDLVTIDLSSLQPGIYFVTIRTQNGLQTGKLMKI